MPEKLNSQGVPMPAPTTVIGRAGIGGWDAIMASPEIIVHPPPTSLAEEAARRFVAIGRQAIDDRGHFTVALAGGSTPAAPKGY